MSCSPNQVRIEAELIGVRAHPRECGLRGLLHDLSELAGHFQPSLTGVGGRFDEEDVAADGGHGEPGRDAGLGGPLANLAGEAARPEPLARPGLVDADLVRPALCDTAGRLSAERGELPLEVADAGLPRVLADDESQGTVAELHLRALEPVGLELLGDEVLARDPELLLLRVAGEMDHVHAVEQRAPGSCRAGSRCR